MRTSRAKLAKRTTKSRYSYALTNPKAVVLGRSALTGTRVLRPATTKHATISVRQVRDALRTLGVSTTK